MGPAVCSHCHRTYSLNFYKLSIPVSAINSLEGFFDKILVVSVSRFTERHSAITQKLEGLSFEFFWGADKLALSPDFISANYDEQQARTLQRQGKALNAGEIACSLSHRMVYEAILRNNWNKVLILEDDVLPLTKELASLPAALEELPPNWELLYLGYLKHEVVTPSLKRKQFFYRILSRLGFMKWSPVMVNNLLPVPFSPHLRKAGFHDCTHAYALTREGAAKLLAAQTPVVYRADDLLSAMVMKGAINGFITDPKFFDQEVFHNAAAGSEIR